MKVEPIKIEEIENIDISDEYCQNELIEYFNKLIIKHGRRLKKEGEIIIYKKDFITFPGKDIIETVVDLFFENGFTIYFYTMDTNETKLHISTNKNDLYDEFYEMDFETMTGTFHKVKNIHRTCDDKHKGKAWIERIAITEFGHKGLPYRVMNLSETGFDIIKLEPYVGPINFNKQKKRSLLNLFK